MDILHEVRAYLSCLATYQLPSLGSVEFHVTLHVRQSKTRQTDSQTSRTGPLEVLERMGRMGWQPALEWFSGLLRPAKTASAP